MGKIYHGNTSWKKAEVALLILYKTNFEANTITRNKEDYFIMTCISQFKGHNNPIIFSIFQMGLREIKQFAQDASGIKIRSQADGSDARVQFVTITNYCWRQRKTMPELTKGTCTESKCQF